MTVTYAPTRRGIVLPIVMTLVGLAVLIGLGLWQLERKAWKDAIVASLSEKFSAAPVSLPARETWPRLGATENEFKRVTFPAEFLHDAEALVYSVGSALRADVSGPGYWVFTPARLSCDPTRSASLPRALVRVRIAALALVLTLGPVQLSLDPVDHEVDGCVHVFLLRPALAVLPRAAAGHIDAVQMSLQ